MKHQLILAGFGGQGLMLMGKLLCITMMQQDKHVTYVPSYGAEMRGGTANCNVSVSDDFIASPLVKLGTEVVVMNQPSYEKFNARVAPGGKLFVNTSLVEVTGPPDGYAVIEAPVTEMAIELGDVRMANMIMLGVLNHFVKFTDFDDFINNLGYFFKGKKEKLIESNIKAIRRGEEFAKELARAGA
jgi:2-oxoglutarate ferredoxin oxidoreductase subunit gamma